MDGGGASETTGENYKYIDHIYTRLCVAFVHLYGDIASTGINCDTTAQ